MWNWKAEAACAVSIMQLITTVEKAAAAIIAIFLFSFSIESHAQSCPGSVPAGTECVAYGATKEITAGDCLQITNSHARGKAIMVPVKTNAEWARFKANLPAGLTSAACVASSCASGVQNFNTPGAGTFTVPAGCTSLTVEVWGGGGAGADGWSFPDAFGTTYAGGSGGGSGGYARAVVAVAPGQSISYSVGAGGVRAASHGQQSSANGLLANGGKSGLAAGQSIGPRVGPSTGGGGTASGGTTNTVGSSGGDGVAAYDCMGGWWGGGFGGSSPSGGAGGAGGLTTAGSPGGTPGAGGGGGAYDCDASQGNAGGNGANGRVRFSY